MSDDTDIDSGSGTDAKKDKPKPLWDEHSLDSSDYTPPDATDSGIDALSLEVTVLSIASVDRIASEIARKVETVASERAISGVAITDPRSIERLRTHAAMMGQLAALEAQVTEMEKQAAAAKKKAEESGDEGLEGGFVDLAATYTAARGARAIANNVGKVLRSFEATSVYKAPKVDLPPSVLQAALAKHISGRGLEAQVPAYAVKQGAGSEFIDRLIDLQSRCEKLSDNESAPGDSAAVTERVKQLISVLLGASTAGDSAPGSGSASLMQQLVEAQMLADAVAKGFGLLTVELSATGGSYRMRRWILNGLLGRDNLTYSGGAAVTYFLLAGDSMASLASDTVYFATGHGNFGKKYEKFSATNIPGLDGW